MTTKILVATTLTISRICELIIKEDQNKEDLIILHKEHVRNCPVEFIEFDSSMSQRFRFDILTTLPLLQS